MSKENVHHIIDVADPDLATFMVKALWKRFSQFEVSFMQCEDTRSPIPVWNVGMNYGDIQPENLATLKRDAELFAQGFYFGFTKIER